MLLLALAVLTGVFWGMAADPAALPKIKIVLVGDSTVVDGSGWGPGLAALLNAQAQCVNCAQSGRSSKSFRAEGWWEKALAEKPDYILIQFGHNDQPGKGPDRETDPQTTYADFLRQYVDEARAIGAKPILVTSVVRRTFGPDGKIQSSFTAYVEAMIRVAAEKQVPLVDLYARSRDLHERLGPEESDKFNLVKPPKPEGAGRDRTHLCPEGAKRIGALVAQELRKVEPDLAPYLPAELPEE